MVAGKTTDTIAAIATPPGTGGIGIIRISGNEALSILKQLFVPKYRQDTFESHKLYYGTLTDGAGNALDEVLAVYMKGPATYTREDVVEIHCHGTYILLQSVLNEVFARGARIADPGEFTKRAFLAGRLDLTQAEAVIDLLNAQTDKGIHLAVQQLQGGLAEELEGVRKGLIEVLAILEVAIDFPDDDVELIDTEQMSELLENRVLLPVNRLIRSAAGGKVIRDGLNVVIAGRPNVGKSSLLNALLREDRALVTAIPGTTRDTIEETISIRGVPLHLVDTAGIRAHSDAVEELGMERARRKMESADLVLFLVDASEKLTERDRDLYQTVCDKKHLIIFNKKDLVTEDELGRLRASFPDAASVAISAKNDEGIVELQNVVYDTFILETGLREVSRCAPNTRHLVALNKTEEAVRRLLGAISLGAPCDLLAVEAQSALDYLGDIVGLTTPDDVLDAVFAEFCIGK